MYSIGTLLFPNIKLNISEDKQQSPVALQDVIYNFQNTLQKHIGMERKKQTYAHNKRRKKTINLLKSKD